MNHPDPEQTPSPSCAWCTVLAPAPLRLEDRIVLEAAGLPDGPTDQHAHSDVSAAPDHADDGGHADASHLTEHDAPHPQPSADHDVVAASLARALAEFTRDGVAAGGHRLLLISDDVSQADALAQAAGAKVTTIVFDADAPLDALLQQIQAVVGHQDLKSIALATHGDGDGGFALTAGHAVDLAALSDPQMQAFWRGLAALLRDDGRIDLLACDVAGPDAGDALVARLEAFTGVDFAASADATGAASSGGDWLLESDGIDVAPVYFDGARLTEFTETLAPPTVTESGTSPAPAVGTHGPVVLDPNITVTDGGTGNLEGAAVRIKTDTFVPGEDVLDFTPSANVNGSYDPDTGILILSGSASAAEYQAVLRSVTYENTSDLPQTHQREILFTIGDNFEGCMYVEETGHYFRMQVVPPNNLSFAAASSAADAAAFYGLQGYLATITCDEEDIDMMTLVPSPFEQVWLGASDEAVEGIWQWITGPEAGTVFWNGAAGGTPVGGMYTSWQGGQPDDGGGVSDHLAIANTGLWRDDSGASLHRFVIEFGGLDVDGRGGLAGSALVATVNIAVEEPNHAPVLDDSGGMGLMPVLEDAIGNGGTRVADIVASAGGDRITDANTGALEGIALIAIDGTHGNWQYSTDWGGSWQDVGNVSGMNALLLRDTDLLRFQPDPNWHGSIPGGISFRAWDRTAGSAGDYVDASATGGEHAFSVASETASIQVAAVNDAPVLDHNAAFALSDIDEDDLLNDGTTVATLLASAGGDRVTDADGNPEGIALLSLDVAHGTWQYSLDGGQTWTDVDSVSSSHALLLRATDLLRFQPDENWNGALTDALTFRAWDQTSGTAGSYANATSGGGSTAFSATTAAAALDVRSVNDLPTLVIPLPDHTTDEDAPFSFQVPADAFADIDHALLNYTATLEDGSPLPAWLVFDPHTRTFSGTPTNDDLGTLRVRVTADDGAGGAVSDIFILTISNTNDPPTVVLPLPEQPATEGAAFQFQVPTGAFVDVDRDELNYSATLANGDPLPDWLVFDPQTRLFTGTPAAGDVGTLQVRISADDGHGGSVSDVFAITVAALPAPDPDPNPDPVPDPGGNSVNPPDPGDPDGPTSPNHSSDHTSSADNGGEAPDDVSTDDPTGGDGWSSPLQDLGTEDEWNAAPDPLSTTESHNTGEAEALSSSAPNDTERADAAGAEAQAVAAAEGSAGGGVAARLEENEPAFADREEEDALQILALNSQVQDALLTAELLADETQPIEFRAAWETILVAYASSGDELATYLQSAFRAVTESACVFKSSEEALAALLSELRLAGDDDLELDLDALVARLRAAQDHVRLASTELQDAIRAAAVAGQEERFDRVLEDVIRAVLQQLMTSNEQLYIETHALATAGALLRAARLSGTQLTAAELDDATVQARGAARAEFVELRKSWDRVAEDVFAAFVARLVNERDADGARPPIDPGI